MTNILIEGIGGIGGIMAARMIQAGYNPALVTANEDITGAINREGLRITTPEGSAVVPARAYTTLDNLPPEERFDSAYLVMKANSVVEAAQKTVPFLTEEGYVVTFQNGVVEDAVAAAIGSRRVVSGIIGWGGTMTAPGVYEKTSGGQTHIGELSGIITNRLRELGMAIETAAPVVMTDNIRGALWSKLAINCTITTLGALTGELLGDMLRDRQTRQVFMRTYGEVVETADALGIHLETIATNPRTLYVPSKANPFTMFVRDLLVRVVGRRYGRLKSSMLQSLERGRKTEIDYLNGYVVERAQNVNVPAPVNAALTRMIREIEAGTRKIERRNLDELLSTL